MAHIAFKVFKATGQIPVALGQTFFNPLKLHLELALLDDYLSHGNLKFLDLL